MTSGATLFAGPEIKAGRFGEHSDEVWDNVRDIQKIKLTIRESRGRKGLVYLMGYPIPYRTIPYHGTVSGGGHTRPLIKIWDGILLVSWNGLGNF